MSAPARALASFVHDKHRYANCISSKVGVNRSFQMEDFFRIQIILREALLLRRRFL